ncbi:unnamed protein product [Amaranthus hypochondriacus]
MEKEEDHVPMNKILRGVWEWVPELESDIEMWEPIMPRPIVLSNSEGEAKLNGLPERLSNTVGPLSFGGNANIWGWLRMRINWRISCLSLVVILGMTRVSMKNFFLIITESITLVEKIR